MICNKNHRYLKEFDGLPDAQDNENGRHICAGCAYEKGMRDAINGKPYNSDLSGLRIVKLVPVDTKALRQHTI